MLLYSCLSLSCFLQNQHPATQSGLFAGSVITLWLELNWRFSLMVEQRLHLLAPGRFLQLELPVWVPFPWSSLVTMQVRMCCFLKVILRQILLNSVDLHYECTTQFLCLCYVACLFFLLYCSVRDSWDSIYLTFKQFFKMHSIKLFFL